MLENKKEGIKLLLERLSKTGIEVSDLKNELESIYTSYIKNLSNTDDIKRKEKLTLRTINSLNQFLTNITNLNNALGLYEQFQIYKRSLLEEDKTTYKELLNSHIKDIILDLKILKKMMIFKTKDL